jgi:hypothetical protein
MAAVIIPDSQPAAAVAVVSQPQSRNVEESCAVLYNALCFRQQALAKDIMSLPQASTSDVLAAVHSALSNPGDVDAYVKLMARLGDFLKGAHNKMAREKKMTPEALETFKKMNRVMCMCKDAVEALGADLVGDSSESTKAILRIVEKPLGEYTAYEAQKSKSRKRKSSSNDNSDNGTVEHARKKPKHRKKSPMAPMPDLKAMELLFTLGLQLSLKKLSIKLDNTVTCATSRPRTI